MATAKIVLDEGTTTNTATYTGTEDAVTKHVGRVVLNNSSLTEIGTASNPIRTDPTGTTAQPVSAASLPLPTGAATAANQTTANTSLSDLDTNTGAIADAIVAAGATGSISAKLRRATQGLEDLKTLIVLAAGSNVIGGVTEADGANTTLGSKADAKNAATDTTAISVVSILKQISSSIQAAASSLAGTLTVATHAVTQSGTWTVQPGNTANTTAWKVDGSAVTQPISGTVTANQGTNPWVIQESITLPSYTTAPDSVGIAASSSGDNTLISAPGAGKVIYVYGWNLSFSGTVNAKFTDGAAGTNKAGLYYGIANAGAGAGVKPPCYLFKCTSNTALVLNLSAAIAVGGSVSYFVI